MHTLKLKHGDCLFDDQDAPQITPFKWYSRPSTDGRRIYAVTSIAGKTVYMHRLILPTTNDVDHVNRDGLDNRRENLRGATRSQNMANGGSKGGSSRYKGVALMRRVKGDRWGAWIMVNRQNRYLGTFLTEEDAARAYDDAAYEAWGDYAHLNLPRDVAV